MAQDQRDVGLRRAVGPGKRAGQRVALAVDTGRQSAVAGHDERVSGDVAFGERVRRGAGPDHGVAALAVTTSKRHPSLPDVPTMHETGLTNFELAPWWGVYFPTGTPQDIVDKVGRWINQISATEDAAAFLARVGSFPLVEDGKTLG